MNCVGRTGPVEVCPKLSIREESVMEFRVLTRIAVVGVVLAGLAGTGLGEPTKAITLNGAPAWSNNFGNYNVGFRFTANAELYVTHLGAFDEGGDGFSSYNIEVGIFETDGDLLGSKIVGTGDTLEGQFRFTELSQPLLLAEDTDYYAIAYHSSSEKVAAKSSVTVDPNITYVENVEQYGGPFKFVTQTDGAGWDAGFFGANFKVAPTPEPTAFLLLAMVGVPVALKRRRRRRAA